MWLGICTAKTNWFNLLPCVPSRNLWFPVDSSCINHDYGDNKDDDSDNMEMVIKKNDDNDNDGNVNNDNNDVKGYDDNDNNDSYTYAWRVFRSWFYLVGEFTFDIFWMSSVFSNHFAKVLKFRVWITVHDLLRKEIFENIQKLF